MTFPSAYLTCPKCKGECFKEYALDIVTSKNVSIHKNGGAAYVGAEIDGYCTEYSPLAPSPRTVLFYVCEHCGEMLHYLKREKRLVAVDDKESYHAKIKKVIG